MTTDASRELIAAAAEFKAAERYRCMKSDELDDARSVVAELKRLISDAHERVYLASLRLKAAACGDVPAEPVPGMEPKEEAGE